jgi:hypothetical protein
MAKYFIKIQYNNIELISDPEERNDKELEEMKTFCDHAIEGKFSSMHMDCKGNTHFIPEKILINSIISIQKVE